MVEAALWMRPGVERLGRSSTADGAWGHAIQLKQYCGWGLRSSVLVEAVL